MFSLVSFTIRISLSFFFFNDTATTEIYTLSLHDALPISEQAAILIGEKVKGTGDHFQEIGRSEEHTSELQSQSNLVCRLLLEKKKTIHKTYETLRDHYNSTTDRRLVDR